MSFIRSKHAAATHRAFSSVPVIIPCLLHIFLEWKYILAWEVSCRWYTFSPHPYNIVLQSDESLHVMDIIAIHFLCLRISTFAPPTVDLVAYASPGGNKSMQTGNIFRLRIPIAEGAPRAIL